MFSNGESCQACRQAETSTAKEPRCELVGLNDKLRCEARTLSEPSADYEPMREHTVELILSSVCAATSMLLVLAISREPQYSASSNSAGIADTRRLRDQKVQIWDAGWQACLV